jgi:hypothetical protein
MRDLMPGHLYSLSLGEIFYEIYLWRFFED